MHGADLINLLKPCKGASLRVIQATGSIQSVLQSYIKKNVIFFQSMMLITQTHGFVLLTKRSQN